MTTPFTPQAQLRDLLANLDMDPASGRDLARRMKVMVTDRRPPPCVCDRPAWGRIYQVVFDGRGIPGQASARVVLTVYPSEHPTSKRHMPAATTPYVVMYDTPKRDDVFEEVRSCEQLGSIAMDYCIMPDQEALAEQRFADKLR